MNLFSNKQKTTNTNCKLDVTREIEKDISIWSNCHLWLLSWQHTILCSVLFKIVMHFTYIHFGRFFFFSFVFSALTSWMIGGRQRIWKAEGNGKRSETNETQHSFSFGLNLVEPKRRRRKNKSSAATTSTTNGDTHSAYISHCDIATQFVHFSSLSLHGYHMVESLYVTFFFLRSLIFYMLANTNLFFTSIS